MTRSRACRADATYGIDDLISVEGVRHQTDMLLVGIRINGRLDVRLEHVVNGQPETDRGQWAGVRRVAARDSLSEDFGAVGIRGAEDDYNVLGADFLNELLDG